MSGAGDDLPPGLLTADEARVALLDPWVRLAAVDLDAARRVLVAGEGSVAGVARAYEDVSVWVAPRLQSLRLLRSGETARARVDEADAIGEVLDRWEVEVLRHESGPDSVASVTLASADAAAVAPLVARHFGASVVLAVRPVREADAAAAGAGPPGAGGLRVRVAGPDDLELLVDAMLAVHAADRAWGFVPEVPDLAARSRPDLAEELSGAPGWAFVAEADDVVLGVCQVLAPHQAGWVTGSLRPGPAAYVSLTHVAPAARTRGVGRALVAAAHRRCAEQGVAAVLLHHAAASPLSGPFWARQGYRPLLTTWSRRPVH